MLLRFRVAASSKYRVVASSMQAHPLWSMTTERFQVSCFRCQQKGDGLRNLIIQDLLSLAILTPDTRHLNTITQKNIIRIRGHVMSSLRPTYPLKCLPCQESLFSSVSRMRFRVSVFFIAQCGATSSWRWGSPVSRWMTILSGMRSRKSQTRST